MRRTPAQQIVDFLSFSSDSRPSIAGLRDFRQRDWKHALRWLDDAGLAFYFLRKVKNTNANDTVPVSYTHLWLAKRIGLSVCR